MLWMVQRVFYGEVTDPHNADLPDLDARERRRAGPAGRAGAADGHRQPLFTRTIEPSVDALVRAGASNASGTSGAGGGGRGGRLRERAMSDATLDWRPAIPALILAAWPAWSMLLAQAFAPARRARADSAGAWFSLAGLVAALIAVVVLAAPRRRRPGRHLRRWTRSRCSSTR